MLKAWGGPLLASCLTLAAYGVVGYFSHSSADAQRITAVEVQQRSDDQRLDRIEHLVERIYEILAGEKAPNR